LIESGLEGIDFGEINKLLRGLTLQSFTAATDKVPGKLPTITVKLFVVELPVQPGGKFQK
jgi:hypothetical protein